MVDFTNFNRIATAAVGALIVSTVCIAAATGPAYAVEPSAVSYVASVAPVSVQANA